MPTSDILEQLKNLLENVNLDNKKNILELIPTIHGLVKDWKGRLPDLRDICRSEVIDQFLTAVIIYMNKAMWKFNDYKRDHERGKELIEFVVRTGYKDDRQASWSHRTTPLHHACRVDYFPCVTVARELFKIYDRFDVNQTDESGQLTHFHVACKAGCVDVVERFLDHARVDPECISRETGESPLYLAVRHRHENLAKALLRRGVDPNLANAEGQTALHIISKRDYKCAYMVMNLFELSEEFERPLHVDARDRQGNTPLHLAIASCAANGALHDTTAEVLLSIGANANLANAEGSTPLHIVCRGRRSVDLARLLMEKSAAEFLPLRIDARDAEGNTPLHLALESKRIYLAEFLLGKGANPTLANSKKETVLHLISRRSIDDRTVEALFESHEELDVNAQDELGNTPLHLTLGRHGNRKAAERLLSRGADPHLANAEGLTPLHLCLINEDEVLAKLFFQIIDLQRSSVEYVGRDASGRTQLQRALADLLQSGELDALFDGDTDERTKKRNKQPLISKFRLVAGILIVVESYYQREYVLDQSDVATIMKLFEKCRLLQKPVKQAERRWYDDEEFTRPAEEIQIVPGLSLDDLVRMRPEEQEKRLTYRDYLEFAHSKKVNKLLVKHRDPCVRHLCETMSRGFFRLFALYPFFELIHKRLPIEVCEMIIEDLNNQDLYNICLAAPRQSSNKDSKDNLKTNVKRKCNNKKPPRAKKAKK